MVTCLTHRDGVGGWGRELHAAGGTSVKQHVWGKEGGGGGELDRFVFMSWLIAAFDSKSSFKCLSCLSNDPHKKKSANGNSRCILSDFLKVSSNLRPNPATYNL